MDTLVSMRAFARVAETKNFAHAARRLRLSPAMVTKHIQNLERRLGTRLINRSTRRLSLTEAGAVYYDRCLQLLSDLEEAEAAAGSLGALPRGLLRISAPMYFGTTELRPILQSFMQKYRDISIDLLITNRNIELIEEGCDLAVRIAGAELDPSLIARKLATARFLVCAAPSYLKRAGVPQKPEDLHAHCCLGFNVLRWRDGWTFTRNGDARTVKVPLCLQCNNNEVLAEAAADGVGVSVQPTFNVWRHLASGRLVTLLTEWSVGDVGIFVVYPSRKHLPAKTRLFIDFLTAQFPKGPQHDVWLERSRAL
jgi:DNA-binding transcriptional LysR family regulator